MFHYKVMILITVFLLVHVPGAVRADVSIVTGKYHKGVLTDQLELCHHGSCPGCMYTNFPDITNPFETGRNNCEGMTAWSNPIYHWASKLEGSYWESFALFFTSRTMLAQTIDICHQNYVMNVHCTWADTTDGSVYDISGAYYLGTELSLGYLDNYINRGETDWPTGPNYYDWSDLRSYVLALPDFVWVA